MKLKVLTVGNTEAGSKDLPSQFDEEVRSDIIKRSVLAVQSHKRQNYGASPEAGKRPSVRLSKRRHDYRGSYGHGISRVPRKITSRSGTRLNWVGAFAPGTVGGRRAHPPKAEKIWGHKINKKERRKSIRSAIAATVVKQLTENRGHKVPKNYPFIIENKIQDVKKTKEIQKILEKLGLKEELERSDRFLRAGRGRTRGRKYKTKSGPLIVVSNPCALFHSALNIQGVDVVNVQNLNAEVLAPGTMPGRLTLWTEGSIERLAKEKLFTNEYVAPKKEEQKKEIPVVKKEVAKKPVKKEEPKVTKKKPTKK